MSLPYEKSLIERSRKLRKEMTEQEKKIWYCYLQKYPLHFQRQKTIEHYIVDFYCHKAKLAIEIDGSQHYSNESMEYDKKRTEDLNELGVLVLRYTNKEIALHFATVCNEIDRIAKERMLNK